MKANMKNYLLIVYLLLHLSSRTEAQTFQAENQFLVSEDTALYFCRIDNHTFTLQNSSQLLTAHLDSTLLDTISLSGAWMNTRISMNHNSNVLWVELHNIENPELRKQYFMDLDKKDFVNTFNNNIYTGQNFFELSGKHIYGGDFISNTQYVDVLPYISILKEYNVLTGETKALLKFPTDSTEAKGIVEFYKNKDNALAKLATSSSDFVHLNTTYHHFNTSNEKLTQKEYDFDFEKVINEISDSYLYIKTNELKTEEKDGNTFAIDSWLVLDENYDILSEVLPKYTSPLPVKGLNTIKDQLYSYNVATETDQHPSKYKIRDYKKELVGYRAYFPLERSFYRAYHNEEVLNEDLDVLDSNDLQLLRNFLFAKHNYQFDNPYYQAYFNVFAFYREGRKNRTKDINAKLSNADSANLDLINKAIKIKAREEK